MNFDLCSIEYEEENLIANGWDIKYEEEKLIANDWDRIWYCT